MDQCRITTLECIIMNVLSNNYKRQNLILTLVLSLLYFVFPALSAASQQSDLASFQRTIVDYRPRLNPKFKKINRTRTRYIIVHTSELGLQSTLRVVSTGKWVHNGRWCTSGGHTHYVIARNGRTYRILDKQYIADHAGRSMWNKETNLSQLSIGIELVGYHYTPITEAQYRSVGKLIEILQDVYHLDDRAVLTHSQIAFGLPNRWIKRDHRGRKRCAQNFIRAKAGLGPTWPYDPDVHAGRLLADKDLAGIFYGSRSQLAKLDEANIISKTNSAWAIAGDDFDSPTTVYQFPNGSVFTGQQIAANNGWNQIPAKTVVLLNQEDIIDELRESGPIKTISDGITAWSLAGKQYNNENTFYLLPSGRIRKGSTINDWDDLPVRTKLIIGYDGPFTLSKERSAYRIAGKKYKDPKTIYYLPPNQLQSGNKIEDFSQLQAGTLVFLPASL